MDLEAFRAIALASCLPFGLVLGDCLLGEVSPLITSFLICRLPMTAFPSSSFDVEDVIESFSIGLAALV